MVLNVLYFLTKPNPDREGVGISLPAWRTSGSSEGFLCWCVPAAEGVMLALLLLFELYLGTFRAVTATGMLNGNADLMLSTME